MARRAAFADGSRSSTRGCFSRPARHRQDAHGGRGAEAGDSRDSGARGLFYDTRELLRVIRSTYNPVIARRGDGHPAARDAGGPAGARRSRRGEDVRMGRGDDEPRSSTRGTTSGARRSSRRITRTCPTRKATRSRCKARVGFRIHSRLHEMCEFLEFEGADYRHAAAELGRRRAALALEARRNGAAGYPPGRRLRSRPSCAIPARPGTRGPIDVRWSEEGRELEVPGGASGSPGSRNAQCTMYNAKCEWADSANVARRRARPRR